MDRREMYRDSDAILKVFVPKDRLKTPPSAAVATSSDVSPNRISTIRPSMGNQTQRATKME